MSIRPKTDRTAEAIVVRASRPMLVTQCVLHLLALWLSWRLWGVSMNWSPSAMPLLFLKAYGLLVFGVMLLASGIRCLCFLSRLIFNCPLFILTPEGIYNGSYGTVFPFTRWQAIEKISVTDATSSLKIFVYSPGTNHPDSALAQFVWACLRRPGQSFALITVSETILPERMNGLFEQIRAYCADQRVGEQIQFIQESEES